MHILIVARFRLYPKEEKWKHLGVMQLSGRCKMSGLLKPELLYKKLASLKHTASQGPRFLDILQWGTVPFYAERSIGIDRCTKQLPDRICLSNLTKFLVKTPKTLVTASNLNLLKKQQSTNNLPKREAFIHFPHTFQTKTKTKTKALLLLSL